MRTQTLFSIRQLFLSCLATLLLISQAWAQNPDSPAPTPRQGGGGGGFGISIDIGSVINAVRNRQNQNKENDEIDRSAKEQLPLVQPPMTLELLSQRLKADYARKATRQALRTGASERAGMKLAPQTETCAINGNFELSNFTQWSGADNGPAGPRNASSRFSITNSGINQGAIGLDTSHQTIVAPGNDPTLAALLQQNPANGGNSAARLGNKSVLWGGESLAKSFKVSPANAIVGFSYAVVMQNPAGHSPADQPSFAVRVLDANGVDITNNIAGGRVKLSPSSTPNVLVADAANPFFKTFGSGAGGPLGGGDVVVYKDWACSEINLSDLIGQDVTIEFITIDCGQGGHWAYAYVDDFCSTCGPSPEGSVQAAPSDDCGIGKICVDITVPKTGTQTGQATVSLDIWQNGIKLTTLNQPAINADGKVCFPINPSAIAGLDTSKGFDYNAKADLKIGSFTLPSKLLGAGPNGVKPDRNNDYQSTCPPNGGGGTCGTPGQPPCPTCGQAGQPPCPPCGQPGQPLCVDMCTPSNPTGSAGGSQPRAATGAANRLGNLLGSLRAAARGTADKPPALEKKAFAVGPSVNGNYTINWVVSYANTSNQALSNVIVRDGPISTIIPGSLQQPAGWTGATNSNAPINNYAQWNGAIVPPHGVMTQTLPAAGPSQINVGGNGDGFGPIPYTHPSGRRTYLMNHHEAPGTKLFNCFDMLTAVSCSGAWPRLLPMGDGSGSSGTTSNNAEYVIDSGKIYYAAQNFARWGIGCYNLDTDTECGFTQLGASSSAATQTMLQGPWRIGGELYLADYDGQVYCAKLAAGMPACLSSGYKIPLTDIKLNVPAKNSNALAWANGQIVGKVVGTKLYLTSRTNWYAQNTSSDVKTHNCIDSVTKAACWNTTAPTRGSGATVADPYAYNYSNFIYYSTSGVALANCTKIAAAAGQVCADVNTGLSLILPAIFPSHPERNVASLHQWPRTYFNGVGPGNANSGQGWCWDWSAANYCQGVIGSLTGAMADAFKSEYGSGMDDRGCVWVYGHFSKLWGYDPNSLDPVTGLAKPCGGDPGKAQLTFQPLQYCSGPKPFKWTAVEVKGTSLVNMDKLIVKVLDATTSAVLYTKDLKAGSALSTPITSVNAQTESKPLKIELEYTPKAGTNDKPYVEVRYDAPALEFCFTSTHTCAQGNITNKVETQDPLNLSSVISASATVVKPQDCPCVACGTANTPSCPTCGQPGQPVCPPCGQPGQAPCGTCGGAGQPPCTSCGGVGQLPCSGGPGCIPGTPGCPIIIFDGGCIPGTPGCTVRPPPRDPVCLTGNCNADKPQQSIAEEYKAPKVSCVRKPKEAEEVKKVSPPKPKPKPVAANPAPKPAIEADAKPAAPKPRPKPAPKPKAQDDDDC
jgi:hypothetical protein